MSAELDAIRKRYESDVHWGVHGETNKRFVSDIGTLFARIAELETELKAQELETEMAESAATAQSQYASREYQENRRMQAQLAEANKVIDAIDEVGSNPYAYNNAGGVLSVINKAVFQYRKKATS